MQQQELRKNRELIKALESLPTPEEFLKQFEENNLKKDNISSNAIISIPYLRELHKTIYELLPKPNKGLWEPQFNLDPFILAYFAIAYQNQDKKQQQLLKEESTSYSDNNKPNNSKEEEKENIPSVAAVDVTPPQRLSKL
ncbi:hypothetical protein ABK040_015385 [Willaertia magna]